MKKLFNKEPERAMTVKETVGAPHTLVLNAYQDDSNNTQINLELGEGMTNDEYIAMTSNTILYLAINNVVRYNLNPQAYVALLEKDLLNALANAQLTAKEEK